MFEHSFVQAQGHFVISGRKLKRLQAASLLGPHAALPVKIMATKDESCSGKWSKPFPKQAFVFMCLQDRSFENNVEKGEIAHNEQFLLFPQCFLPFFENFPLFSPNLKLSTANNCRSGIQLTLS